jgi:hypothetical protein
MTTFTVRKDIAALRAAAATEAEDLAEAARVRLLARTPRQQALHEIKVAEARRYLALYPNLRDQPAPFPDDPEAGFPYLAQELGVTRPSAWALARLWIERAAADRANDAAIEGLLRRVLAIIASAAAPGPIRAAIAGFSAALDALHSN